MDHSVISTKINIPLARKDVVMRPHLMGLLVDGLDRRVALTLISAPAGYGKTTLVASWLRALNRRHAWFSIETEDDDLTRFVDYLLAALEKAYPAIGKAKQLHIRELGIDFPKMDLILSNLLQFASKLRKSMVVVLEDYHFIESPDIHSFVEKLIEHLHPYLHFIITTRSEPRLPLARWRARNQLVEIGVADLQFTLNEAGEFLQRNMQLDLSADEICLLEEQTEGWVAGLQLAALSRRDNRATATPWTIASSQPTIFEYLMTEVLEHLPQERREFLLQTSLISRLSGSLCDALTGWKNGQHVLESLEDANLFTLAIDGTGEWFRYHHLFAEFLRRRSRAEYSEEFLHGLHRRASHWFRDHGYTLDAIDHALSAMDYEYAACLIGPQADQWMRRGEISTILKYLDQLPRELVWDQWELCLWYGWAHAVIGKLDAAETWTNRLEALITPLIQESTTHESGLIPNPLRNAYVQVLGIRSVIARHTQDFDSAVALSEQALQLIPPDNTNLRAIISAMLASATLGAGDFDHAESVLHSTRQMAYRVGNPYITFTILLNESALASMRGQLRRAYDLNSEALHLAQAESLSQLIFLPYLRLGRIHYFWNRLSQARQYITYAIEHARLPAYPVATVQSYITLSCIQNTENQYEQALQTLAEAEKIALEYHEEESAARVKGTRAQLQLSMADHESVGRWVKSSGWDFFDPSRSDPIFSEESFFSSCQYLLTMGQAHEWERVRRLLEWRMNDAVKQKRGSTILRVHLMQAMLYQAQRQDALALSSLLQALEIAQPEGFVSPFLVEGRTLLSSLQRVPRRHVTRKFADEILSYVSNQPQTINLSAAVLSAQEINILQRMAQGYTSPEIATQLILAVSTVRWYTKQIYRKLGVHNRTQAAIQARRLHLL